MNENMYFEKFILCFNINQRNIYLRNTYFLTNLYLCIFLPALSPFEGSIYFLPYKDYDIFKVTTHAKNYSIF